MKIYWPEEITAILWPYVMKALEEQFNELKVDDDGIILVEKFSGTTTYITL